MNNFIYHERTNSVFAYIPKVACTNWKAVLRRLCGEDNWLDPKLAHDKKLSGLTYFEPDISEPRLGFPSNAKFYTMVRDPYSRVLSAYLNKIEPLLPITKDIEESTASGNPTPHAGKLDYWEDIAESILSFSSLNRNDLISPQKGFEVFLTWLLNSSSFTVNDEHWASQYSLLCQPYVKFDFTGRFEQIEQDSEKILKYLEADFEFPTQKQVKFAPTKAKDKLEKYITDSSERMIEILYAHDFEAFNYPLRSSNRPLKKIALSQRSVDPVTGFISVKRNVDEINNNDNRARLKLLAESDRNFGRYLLAKSQLPELIARINDANCSETIKIYDIGANDGRFGIATHQILIGSSAKIELVSVEPNPNAIQNLVENHEYYGIDSSLQCLAVTDRKGTAEFEINVEKPAASKVVFGSTSMASEEINILVGSTTLSELLTDARDSLTLLKLDINGMEAIALTSLIKSGNASNSIFITKCYPWQIQKNFNGQAYFEILQFYYNIFIVDSLFIKNDVFSEAPIVDTTELDKDWKWLLLVPKKATAVHSG